MSLTILSIFDVTISAITLIGVVMMTGIVVNNAIVLIDYINLIMNDSPKINRETFVLRYNRADLMLNMVKSMQKYSNG